MRGEVADLRRKSDPSLQSLRLFRYPLGWGSNTPGPPAEGAPPILSVLPRTSGWVPLGRSGSVEGLGNENASKASSMVS
jgi:hypothetical protein